MRPLDQKEFWDLHLETLHGEEEIMRYEKIKNLIIKLNPDKVLDLGCGTGELNPGMLLRVYLKKFLKNWV